jgi:single-strand DNA-binding protein
MNDYDFPLNDMNSVVFEGTLIKDPTLSHDQKGAPRCLLVIASERCLRGENGMEKQITGMSVYTKNKLAEQSIRLCRQGRKIRVIGCLQTVRAKDAEGRDVTQTVIDAEHFEVKPEFTKKQKKEPAHESYDRY